MIFAAPWVLLALAALPLLWWLLRVTPPAPRRERFPAIRLLLGLTAAEETPARTPWWLLALRLTAAALIIVGLARPVLHAAGALAGDGPVLVVVDDGWAAAPDWPRRMRALDGALERVARAGRRVALLTTAEDAAAAPPAISPLMPVAELRRRLAAIRPLPWASDRAASAAALAGWHGGGVLYLADGLTDGPGWRAFAAALARLAPVTELRRAAPDVTLLLPPRAEADRLVARLARPAGLPAARQAVLAQSGDGRTLARVDAAFAAGATGAEAAIALPPELRNQLSRLVLADAAPSAGGVVLLDERWRRRPVGLVSEGALGVETPLLGKLFYLHRALDPYTEVREGDVASLLKRQISVIVLADHVVLDGPEHDALANWVQKGGLLLRFAGPQMAAHPDSLLPVTLLEGDRRLGGAMSWSKPAALAAFASDSPFAGLAVPPDVRVTRQVLAQPDAALAAATWARLTDGTPLVTQAVRGAGRVVLFHVTANADWSDLPLSGLFVDMLRRLVAVANGVSGGERGGQKLAPAQIMDGFGVLGPPPAVATGLTAAELANAAAGPRHPPGLYGPAADRRVLNLSANLPLPVAAPAVGTRVEPIDAASAEQPIGPFLLALALALLAADLLVSLRLRGLLLARAAALLVMALVTAAMVGAAMVAMAGSARAQDGPWPQGGPNPALQTRLAYVVTGDAQVDAVSRAGLQGLADFVNHRTAAVLAAPAGVVPGQDDLSFYPLLYWPITADAPTPSEAMVTALNAFTAHGGIILIDTRGGGSGAGFAPGAASALERLGQGLAVPPLAPLTSSHVLARSFYLLREFPGRYVGETVWVQRDQDRSNDSVSPVIIGANDWAAAWAVDGQGRNPYAAIPGGERQRLLAYRFGVNLVMYALTGNYKGDQVHVPAILERLGQ